MHTFRIEMAYFIDTSEHRDILEVKGPDAESCQSRAVNGILSLFEGARIISSEVIHEGVSFR